MTMLVFVGLTFLLAYFPTSLAMNGDGHQEVNGPSMWSGQIIILSTIVSVFCSMAIHYILKNMNFLSTKHMKPIKEVITRTEPIPVTQSTPDLPSVPEGVLRIGVCSLKKVVLCLVQSLLLNLYNIQTKLRCKNSTFKSEKELPFTMAANQNTIHEMLQASLEKIFGADETVYSPALSVCFNGIFESSSPHDMLKAAFDACHLCLRAVREWGVENDIIVGTVPKEGKYEYLHYSVNNRGNILILNWDSSLLAIGFIDTIVKLAQILRDERRPPTPTEFLAFHVAYYKLSSGEAVTLKPYKSLGSPGFRPHTQTYMSLTDPGDGHVLGTTRYNEWIKGAIIHVEHLERPRNLPREKIESYRIPSLLSFSKVRLHVGSAAPTTYFVGRRMKDSGNFEEDFLKVVHLTSASASAVFYQGGAECKVAMEGLTTSQAVRYMRALREHVHRNKHKQILSAAWNLNQTVVDDFEQEVTANLTERIDIAKRAIQITSIGGFDKVTWDGASDTYPSKCIMYQLTFEDALTIVHEAHERGLLTYFSAGFKFGEIKHAVWAGVDGIGIGGAQVLRYMDANTGMHGPYMEENIPEIMRQRDEAANSVRGRGVRLLARLDTMFSEGSISKDENDTRVMLYSALLDKDENEILSQIGKLSRVINMCEENRSPLMGMCCRLVNATQPLLKDHSSNETEWNSFVAYLKKVLDKNDDVLLEEEYDGEPWHTYRRKYKLKLQGKCFQRACSYTLPCKVVG